MTVSTIRMSAEQFLELGEDPVGVRLELVDGEVAVSPSPMPRHAYAAIKLASLLDGYIEENDLGELYLDVDTVFGPHDVRRPDLIFFSKKRLHLVGEKAMQGAPDLCVEIVSPSGGVIDRKAKFRQYEKGKVAYYWIVDPAERSFASYKLIGGKYRRAAHGGGDEVVQSPPFSDLQIPLRKLWRKP